MERLFAQTNQKVMFVFGDFNIDTLSIYGTTLYWGCITLLANRSGSFHASFV